MAQRSALPLLGGSDAHLPRQFGTTYSLIESDPDPEGVLDAIRAGQVRVVSQPLETREMCGVGVALLGGPLLDIARGVIERAEDNLARMLQGEKPGLSRSNDQ